MALFSQLTWSDAPDGKTATANFPNGWSATLLDPTTLGQVTRHVYELQPLNAAGVPPTGDSFLALGPFRGDATRMQIIMDIIGQQS